MCTLYKELLCLSGQRFQLDFQGLQFYASHQGVNYLHANVNCQHIGQVKLHYFNKGH